MVEVLNTKEQKLSFVSAVEMEDESNMREGVKQVLKPRKVILKDFNYRTCESLHWTRV